MSVEHNKAIVRQLVDEVYNKGNMELVDELIAPGFVGSFGVTPRIHGPEGVKIGVTHTAKPSLILFGVSIVCLPKAMTWPSVFQ